MIKHLSTFSGIGGASSAIRQAGLKYRTIAISEYAKTPKPFVHTPLKVYKAIHGKVPPNLGILRENTIKSWIKEAKFLASEDSKDGEIDLITGGFPCQPFSGFGKRQGFEDPRFVPARLLHQVVQELQPRYVMLENVKDIITKPFREKLDIYLNWFMLSGYTVTIHVGNPLDMGYIQSRGRVFFIMSRSDLSPKDAVTRWKVSTTTDGLPKVKQRFRYDKIDETQFYKIGKQRAVRFYEDMKRFDCLCARSVDAHDRRFSWIKYEDSGRSPTPYEMFQLFGYAKKPKIHLKQRGGISRANFSYCMGNSWHIGHAAALLKTLPRGKQQ